MLGSVLLLLASLTVASPPAVDPATYVGNVYGTVADENGAPVADALVTIVDSGLEVRSARTGAAGNFLINSVPAPYEGHQYTIVVTHDAYASSTIASVRVMPGAAMALETSFRLGATISHAEHRYRHEAADPPAVVGIENYTHAIFATREGLVGGTTANGHVIVPNDRFAALPSRRALSTNFGHEREVRVSYRGRTTIVAVWDIGPWNIHDDYWNPTEIRETFKDLPRGKPEAEAAFLQGYNGGKDERGRVVRNPAGIDLADGTFLIDLALTNNDYAEVEYLWLDSTGPTVSNVVALPNPAPPSMTITIDATVSDASPIAGAEFFVDAIGPEGSGIPAIAADGAFDATTEAITLAYGTEGWESGSTHTISVRARDVYGNWGPITSTTVTIAAPLPKRRAVRR